MISILIPAYNCQDYIDRCLDSVLRQTSVNYKIVVIDDCSIDKTAEILAEYKSIFKDRLEVFKNNENRGLSYNRNKLINLCETEYFIFVDADDTINEELIEKLESNVYLHNPELIRFQSTLIKNNEAFPDKYTINAFSNVPGTKALYNFLASEKIFGQTWMYCYSKKLFENYNLKYPENKLQEDFRLTLCVIYLAKSVMAIDYNGYNYYRNSGSIMENKTPISLLKKAKDVMEHYDEIVAFFESIKYSNLWFLINRYISKGVMVKLNQLPIEYKEEYSKQINERNIDYYANIDAYEYIKEGRQKLLKKNI